MSQLFASGGQSIGASASILTVNIQGWFHLGLTGLISLLSKGLFKSLLQHHSLKASIQFLPSRWHKNIYIYIVVCVCESSSEVNVVYSVQVLFSARSRYSGQNRFNISPWQGHCPLGRRAVNTCWMDEVCVWSGSRERKTKIRTSWGFSGLSKLQSQLTFSGQLYSGESCKLEEVTRKLEGPMACFY